ncbi:MAG TPA: M56 family metallopeptidase [Pyrinomonadaceae bacterium]|jgi:beta-lactamase regulating signal transducer with metallopeptidase domain/peptidoglycan/xylan/chitin deacetylase (PgdA/CDA1 family)
MRYTHALLAHPVFQLLGWTLLHFVWQGALVALAYAGIAFSLRRSTANLRYAVACASMFLMLALPVSTFFQLNSKANANAASERERHAAHALEQPVRGDAGATERPGVQVRLYANLLVLHDDAGGASAPLQRWAVDRFTSALPWLVLLWLAGALVLTLRLAGGWVLTERLRREPATPLARDWRETLARLARQLRVSRTVRLCESALVEVPTVIGWLRPVILVPASALTGLSAPQLEALLAHELAHIRRHDYLFNLLQSVVETLLFYHPAVWWLSGRVRVEREHACDDLAVRTTGDVLVYARALTTLETLRRQQQGRANARTLAVAANGGSLMQRIQRLIKTQPATQGHSSLVACLAIISLALASVVVGAQTFSSLQSRDARPSQGDDAAEKSAKVKRQVAVTFVSLPAVGTYDNARAEKETRRLLASLAANNIRTVGFVNEAQLYNEDEGGKLDEERARLLQLWLDAGHELGTQTRDHTSLYKAPLEAFQQDVLRGEEVTGRLMRERGQPLRFFSYPFLNTGRNRETKEAAERFLAGRGYRIHQVTIDNADWLYGRVYAQARRAEDAETMRRVADEYVPYLERMFEYYEDLSRDTLGYELPQVLMLHAHALNAHKIDELIAMMKRRGYEFTTLDAALQDKAYAQPTTRTGPWGISWLERWAMERGYKFKPEPRMSDFMRRFDISQGGTDYNKLPKSE